MDEEKLVLELVGSIIDIYDDYSYLQNYEDMRSVVNSKLNNVRCIFQSLMKIPSSEEVSRGEMTVSSTQSAGPMEFKFLLCKTMPKLSVDDAIKNAKERSSKLCPDLKKIRSIISQVRDNSLDNQLVIIISSSLIDFLQFYETRMSETEDHLVLLLSESFTYEYTFRKKLNTDLDIDQSIAITPTYPIPQHMNPLNFHSDNSLFQKTYEVMLLQSLNPPLLPLDNRLSFVEKRMRKIAHLTLEIFKKVSGACYFFDLQLSIYINKAFIDLVEVFCVDESKDLKLVIKDFYNKNPILPELVFLLKDLHEMKKDAGHFSQLVTEDILSSDDERQGQDAVAPESFDLVLPLLCQISNAFKRYELYKKESHDKHSPVLKNTYYEFKFPKVLQTYVDILKMESKDIVSDLYYRLVTFEVLKYRNLEITSDCWDLPLHNLCKIMFGTGGEYGTLTTTIYHRLAVFSYARSQSMKRKCMTTWYTLALQRNEDRALLGLYDKTLKRRTMSRWVNRFIKLKSLQLQATKYRVACNRNLAFSKWFNSNQTLKELDNLAVKFTLSRYLVLWEEKSSRLDLEDAYQSFLYAQKRVYFKKISERHERIKRFNEKAVAFTMSKFMSKVTQKNSQLQTCLESFHVVVKQNYFLAWKRVLFVIATKSIVQANNDKHLKKWVLNFWSQRSQERYLCAQFRKIKDDEKLKNQLFSMLLISENIQLARDFYNRKLLREHMGKLKIGMVLRTVKHVKDDILVKKYFRIFKIATRLSLMSEANASQNKKSYLDIWRMKAYSVREMRAKKLNDLGTILDEKFSSTRRKSYLKIFFYKWEEATIRVLEKQSELNDLYDGTVLHRYEGPFFHKWRSELLAIGELNERAQKFDKNIACLNILGLMLDKMSDIEYLYELSNELLEISNLRLLSMVFKSWSLKALKVKNTKNLVNDFKKRSEASVLRNFLMLWKEASSEKQLREVLHEVTDDSISNNSIAYSPLLHRHPKRQSSHISFSGIMNPPSSTPLVNRAIETSFFSPRIRGEGNGSARKALRTPIGTKAPGRLNLLNSSVLNSDTYRRNKAIEFKSRYQGLKVSPSSDGSFRNSYDNYTTATLPPAQPEFLGSRYNSALQLEEVGSNDLKISPVSNSGDDIHKSLDSAITRDRQRLSSRIRSLIDDEIASPRVSPVAVIRERMKNRPQKFTDNNEFSETQKRTGDNLEHTRTSSLTFNERSDDELFGDLLNLELTRNSSLTFANERSDDEVFGDFLNSSIPQPMFKKSFRNLRGRGKTDDYVNESV